MSYRSDSEETLKLQNADGRLDHVDAMRPFGQAAVIATHALLFFAPLATSMTVTSLLVLTRFSRESFFFITALVLTYNYVDEVSFPVATFWKRRLLLTGLPYLVWTIIYYVFITSTAVGGFPWYHNSVRYLLSYSGLHEFFTLLFTGYYQLYFIIVLFEFYVLFPFLLAWLKRVRRWHVWILIGAMAWQIFYDEALRRHLFPFTIGGKFETRLILSYPIYLLGGMIVALNYRAFYEWMTRNALVVVSLTIAAAILAVELNYLHNSFVSNYIAAHSDVFAPLAVLYNVAAVLCLYLLGVFLMSRRRSFAVRAATLSAADASFGIYLSQLIWIPLLIRLDMSKHLSAHISWPFMVIGVIIIVFGAGYIMSEILMRTPLGPAFVGRRKRRVVSSERALAE